MEDGEESIGDSRNCGRKNAKPMSQWAARGEGHMKECHVQKGSVLPKRNESYTGERFRQCSSHSLMRYNYSIE